MEQWNVEKYRILYGHPSDVKNVEFAHLNYNLHLSSEVIDDIKKTALFRFPYLA